MTFLILSASLRPAALFDISHLLAALWKEPPMQPHRSEYHTTDQNLIGRKFTWSIDIYHSVLIKIKTNNEDSTVFTIIWEYKINMTNDCHNVVITSRLLLVLLCHYSSKSGPCPWSHSISATNYLSQLLVSTNSLFSIFLAYSSIPPPMFSLVTLSIFSLDLKCNFHPGIPSTSFLLSKCFKISVPKNIQLYILLNYSLKNKVFFLFEFD